MGEGPLASAARPQFEGSRAWLTFLKGRFVPLLAGRSWSPEEGECLALAVSFGGPASPCKYERFDELSTKIEMRQFTDPSSGRD